MGDWLETGSAFGGDVRRVLEEIRKRGFEPAIWVAPFIAEEASHVFQRHPDWFINDADGAPLRIRPVSFGGWRRGPWYVLDGTHPEAQAHFERVFRTMRREWGCTYFKLDANFWGAMHGGRFHDRRATRIEAYRRGMQAIRAAPATAFCLAAIIRSGRRSDWFMARAVRTTSSALGPHQDHRAAESAAATGRTAGCGGTIPMPSCWPGISPTDESYSTRPRSMPAAAWCSRATI